ncbi:ankyrin repeat domain-containing protein [Wolbachia endosymbiont of Ctenocephalides felis wCfeJ]|uniref:ankyrin repeat domain-containing protein n=1 Tax=Wolbachia endosymbiont of Ctenocephalides felis wCfeJ TaxID=2732594 RepID=UPI002110B5A9|nr:ankyrin repeat domain-containing protein [Wolbachia endosymbiont of Ctenocephalides felis wCfeJ]
MYGRTPLYLATKSGHLEMIKTLINKGAEDIDVVDEDGRTPLHLAARDGRLGIVKTLINRGACVNRVDKDGRTPLRLVVEDDHIRLIPHLFLEPGVQKVVSIEHEHEEVAKILVQYTLLQDTEVNRLDYLEQDSNFNRKVLEYWKQCQEEIRKLKEEDKSLYDFLRESNIDNLVSIWERNKNVRSKFGNQKSLQAQYPEYAHILINKANEAEKEECLKKCVKPNF